MAKGDKEKVAETAATPTESKTISISADALVDLATEIGKLDTQIASASGSDSAAKKAFIEQVVNKHSERVDGMVSNLVDQLGGQDIEILVGLVARLEERLKADLAPKVETFVTEQLSKTQTTSKEQVAALREQRKELLNRFRALREVLGSFGVNTDHIAEPRRSGGGRPVGSGGGTSKKSGDNKEKYRYFMDGKKRPPSQNTFSSLAFYSTAGVPKALDPNSTDPRWSSDQLREFIKGKGVDFPNAETFEVELPNGKKVGARKFTEEDIVELGLQAETSGEQLATQNGEGGIAAGVPEGATA